MSLKSIGGQFRDGLFNKNPLFVQVLGLCASLAITTSTTNSLAMGVAVTAVLTCSNLLISLLRKFIPDQVRIASYIVVISGFVTIVQMLMNAYLPDVAASLGTFLPLIVVNCIILARAEAYASKNKPLPSILDGLTMGLGFTMALFLLGTVREIFGAGSFFGIELFGKQYTPVGILTQPAGAFIVLGCLMAFFQWFRKKVFDRPKKASADGKTVKKDKKEDAVEEDLPAEKKAPQNTLEAIFSDNGGEKA